MKEKASTKELGAFSHLTPTVMLTLHTLTFFTMELHCSLSLLFVLLMLSGGVVDPEKLYI